MPTLVNPAVTAIGSTTVTPRVGIEFGFTPPYSLPAAGAALAIGGNTSDDVAPLGTLDVGQWNGAVFNSYGSGDFIEDYSVAGGYAAGFGSGGHGHLTAWGGAVFDFTDALWKRHDITNGGASYSTQPGFSIGETSGDPWYEMNGRPDIPAPSHPYLAMFALPASMGGGPQGSIVHLVRPAILTNPGIARCAHRVQMNATTCTYSRFTAGSVSDRGGANENQAILDVARNRVWHLPLETNALQTTAYLDLADVTFKTTAGFDWPADNAAGTSAFLHAGIIFKPGNNRAVLYAFDPDNPTAGWQVVPHSGPFVPATYDCYVGHNGKFYSLPSGGGQTLYRLTPPTGNLITGTWVGDTITLTGATIPAHINTVGTHYRSLVNVPAIDCLAWIPGGSNSVYLINPE